MPNKKPKSGFREHPENINRKGRPKVGLALAEIVRDVMETPDPKTKKLKVEALVDEAVRRALRGHFQFWDALMNRAYGKPPDVIELNQDDKPDLSKLTDVELKQYTTLLAKVLSK